MSSKMKIILVFEDLFFHALRDLDEFGDLRVLKIDSLSSNTPSSLSSFMTCPSFHGSIAHNVKFVKYTLFMAFCCCTSPKTLV